MTDTRGLLRRLVIAWDADQDEEFDEAMREARELVGLRLADDADDVLHQLETRHIADEDLDDQQEFSR